MVSVVEIGLVLVFGSVVPLIGAYMTKTNAEKIDSAEIQTKQRRKQLRNRWWMFVFIHYLLLFLGAYILGGYVIILLLCIAYAIPTLIAQRNPIRVD